MRIPKLVGGVGLGIVIGGIAVFFLSGLMVSKSEREGFPFFGKKSLEEQAWELAKGGPGGDREVAMEGLGARWVEEDLKSALQFREESKLHPSLRQAFDRGAMPRLGRLRPRYVLEEIKKGVWWQDQFKDEKIAMMSLLKNEPEEVAAILSERSDRGLWSTVAVATARRLVEEDPVRGIEFAIQLKNSEVARSALMGAVAEWARRDSYEASVWVKEHTDGEYWEYAVAGLATEIAKDLPDEATKWVETINDPDLRRQVLEMIERPEGSEALDLEG